jgi:hypothetical protein
MSTQCSSINECLSKNFAEIITTPKPLWFHPFDKMRADLRLMTEELNSIEKGKSPKV